MGFQRKGIWGLGGESKGGRGGDGCPDVIEGGFERARVRIHPALLSEQSKIRLG